MSEKFIVNSFQTPNVLVDELLKELSGSEVKVYLTVARKTTGWRKEFDAISISQFMELTGLSNRQVINACKRLVEIGLLEKETGNRNIALYKINMCKKVTSEKSSQVKKVHSTYEKSSQVTSEKSSHTKDNIKNTIQNTHIKVSAKAKTSTHKKSIIPVDEIVEVYNEVLGDVLPKVQVITDKRKRQIQSRWKEILNSKDPNGVIRFTDRESGIEWWRKFLKKVRLNPFWIGEGGRGWRADLLWITHPEHFATILEWKPVKQKECANG